MATDIPASTSTLPPLHADLLIVQVCAFLDDGDGQYRFHSPSRFLSRLPGVTVVDCDVSHRFLPALGEAADVLVLTGFDSDLVPLLQRRRAAGKVTVFEANDYYYAIQSWNPLTAKWLDRGVQDSFHQGLTLCDAVQASTEELARRWRERTDRPVAVFPNHLTEVPPLGPPPARPLTVGWGGSPGHFADWYHVAPALERWLAGRPDVHLAVMTNEFAKPFLRLPPERYHFTPFGSLADYLRFLERLDVGLAPLLPTGYNRCRSDVKFLEYASQGVAGVYADLEPYRGIVPGETGLLYRTEAELLQCLDRLADDEGLRQAIRRRAHAHVAAHRRLEDHVGDRLAFYRKFLTDPRPPAPVPAAVLAAAVRDDRYFQLRRQEPEDTLARLSASPSSRDSVQALARLMEQQPAYLAAWQQLGRQLNDLRDHAGALRALERARALDPASARTQSEVGRAYFRLNDLPRARQELEAALTRNPYYAAGWQYLLRLLALSRAADGRPWAERAHRANPANYPLALLGARVYPPDESIAELTRLLDVYAPTFMAEELPAASAAFAEAIRDVAGPQLARPAALELLRRACAVFPASALLANLLAQALHLAGREEESLAEFARGLELRRVALTYRAEHPREDGTFHYGQIAEYIRDALHVDP